MKRKITAFFTLLIIALTAVFPISCKKDGEENTNLVIQVEFSDTESPFTQRENDLLKKAFCGEKDSLDNFIYLNSNGSHKVKSNILGVVKIDKPIDYFMPRYRYDAQSGEYEEVNGIGYDNRYFAEDGSVSGNGKQSAERFFREQELLYLSTEKAVEICKDLGKKPQFENLTLVPSRLNRYVYSGDIFHPHQAKNYTGDSSGLSSAYYTDGVSGSIKNAKIGKTEVGSYVIIPFAYISSGERTSVTTLCHEYMHVLGAPDLYTYDNAKKPVGEFDVMGGESTPEPTQSLAYLKYRMGWLKEGEDILPVTEGGEYSLTAMEDVGGVKAYKITLGSYYEKGDTFYLEYRKLGNGSLASAPTEGVIIYRVNEDNGYISSMGEKANVWRGNAYGDYEVIVFRNIQDFIYGNHTTLNEEEGYTSFGNPDGNVNVILNSDGTNSGIYVEYLGKNADGTARIRVEIPSIQAVAPSGKAGLAVEVGNRNSVYFGDVSEAKTAYVYYSSKPIKNATPDKLLKSKKGELIKTHTSFLKVTLPKPDGIEKYVYVFYQEDGGYSSVTEYKIKGVKDVKLSTVLFIAIGVGIIVPSALLTLISRNSKKRSKKDE
ncbi:MAG: hypothetical protein IKA61_00950 [Clostridia bacterium]|nr:hypothetical protein [Clostridia bacterium]